MILKLSFDSDFSSDEIMNIDNCDFLYATVGNMRDLKSVIKSSIKKVDKIIIDIAFDVDRYRNMLEYMKDSAVLFAPFYNIDEMLNYIKKNNLFEYKFLFNANSYKPVKYQEIVKENNYINSIVEYINRFDLSQYEQTLFAADLIRELKYKHSNSEIDNNIESQALSRDLYRLLEDDSIVCEGYANIYSAVLTKLGINNSVLFYTPTNAETASGHASNLVVLDDKKYKLNGIYTYDLTWVSSKHKNYLRNYNYLGLPIEYDSLAKREKYDLSNEANLIKSPIQLLEERIERAENLSELMAPTKIIEKSLELVEDSFHECYKKYIKNKEEYKYKEYYNKYNNPLKGIKEYFNIIKDKCISEISDKTFYEALYNVRRIENSIDKNKYLFDQREIDIIADKRHAFMTALRTKSGLKHALDIKKTKIQLLLDSIYNCCDEDEIEEVLNKLRANVKLYKDADEQLCRNKVYSDNTPKYDEIDLDAARMRLISVLRKVSVEDTTNPVLKRKKYK